MIQISQQHGLQPKLQQIHKWLRIIPSTSGVTSVDFARSNMSRTIEVRFKLSGSIVKPSRSISTYQHSISICASWWFLYVWTPSFQSQKLPLLFSDLHNTQQTSTCDPKLTKRSTWYQIRVSFTQGKLGQSPSSNPHKEAQKAPKSRQVSDHLNRRYEWST